MKMDCSMIYTINCWVSLKSKNQSYNFHAIDSFEKNCWISPISCEIGFYDNEILARIQFSSDWCYFCLWKNKYIWSFICVYSRYVIFLGEICYGQKEFNFWWNCMESIYQNVSDSCFVCIYIKKIYKVIVKFLKN